LDEEGNCLTYVIQIRADFLKALTTKVLLVKGKACFNFKRIIFINIFPQKEQFYLDLLHSSAMIVYPTKLKDGYKKRDDHDDWMPIKFMDDNNFVAYSNLSGFW
jgi:hypothetical protein